MSARPRIDAEQRRELLALAREAIVRHLETGEILAVDREPRGEAGGVFVTLRRDGELQGCIGWPENAESLRFATVRCAIAAATTDPRFTPLTLEDLPRTEIEISVLSPSTRVEDAAEIIIGRDGLIVEQEGARGLLLPQVAPEQGWDRTAFLEAACRKAGLAEDSWGRGASVYRFTADVFREGGSRDRL